MWGCNLSQVNRWVDVEGEIEIKFLIIYNLCFTIE